MRYAEGRGVEKNDLEAARWFRKAAAQGHAPSQTILGVMYAEGRGVEKNSAEAASWFRRAAENGNDSAQSNLGAMYASGTGVPKNNVEAYLWFNLAAAQGNKEASRIRNILEKRMTREQIAEAQRRSAAWKPKKE